MLDLPQPILLSYPRETVVAEKFEAMVKLGIFNSRMKDFFDLDYLSNNFSFDGAALSSAIAATYSRRKTLIPKQTPVALSSDFFENPEKQKQWKGFLNKTKLSVDHFELSDV